MPSPLRSMFVLGGFGLSTYLPASEAQAATVKAVVDISEQRMRVYINGKKKYSWRVSTGRKGYATPIATFTPFALTRQQYSERWKMKLPYVVSLDDIGTAVHGTYQTSKLGRKASAGCIRLDLRNAAIFYNLVGRAGLWNTQVVIKR